LRTERTRKGTQDWVFRKLNPESLLDLSCPPRIFRFHPQLKTDICLTYRAVQIVQSSIAWKYGLCIWLEFDLSLMEWLDWEYTQMDTLGAQLWDTRQVILQIYGWASYHLLNNSSNWRDHEWDPIFTELVQHRLRVLDGPRRGCIIEPASISTQEIITLVRHSVPIHYQWPVRGGFPPLEGWIPPTAAAASFDPYSFSRTYDFAAYKQAVGEYDNTSKDRAILGRSSAASLSTEYHRRPRPPIYSLPNPIAKPGKAVKKWPMWYFVCNRVGGELTEVSEATMMRRWWKIIFIQDLVCTPLIIVATVVI